MEQDFPGFMRDLGSFALIVSGKKFRKISGCSLKISKIADGKKQYLRLIGIIITRNVADFLRKNVHILYDISHKSLYICHADSARLDFIRMSSSVSQYSDKI